CPLARLPVMAPEDRARVLAKWSRSETAPPPRCLHGLFEAQARLTPQAIALEWRDQSVSYGELERRATDLARRLRARGVERETRVALCLPRTPDMVVAVLAVLEAGGAYVPLDPRYPADRLAYMLDDSRAHLVVTVSPLAGLF